MAAAPISSALLDAAAVAKADPGGMGDIIASLPEQLMEGLRRGLGTPADLRRARRIFIAGMGGSAIAADIFTSWIADRSKAPLRIVRDYRLPPSAQAGDLLVAVSYSGATEETLAAAAQGLRVGCKLIAVTSGGALAALARKAQAEVILVPKGLPPRGAFGHLFGILPAIGEEWLYGDLRGELERAIVHLQELRKELRPDVAPRRNRAKSLAARLKGRVPIVYGAGPFSSVAKRWQTQFNENAKVLAFASVFPEADHNELVGWCEDAAARRFAPILLRDADESPELKHRLDVTAEMIGRAVRVQQVRDDHEELLCRMLGLLFLGDFVSLYLAVLRGVDPVPVNPIDELKARLAGPTAQKD